MLIWELSTLTFEKGNLEELFFSIFLIYIEKIAIKKKTHLFCSSKVYECALMVFNPIALRTAKTLWSFGCSECNRVNVEYR